MKRVALVTGASSGLGRAFALELDRNPREYENLDEVWLIARREDLLTELAGQIKNLVPRIFAMDLCAPGQIKNLESLLDKELGDHGRLHILINNAGFGTYGTFAQTGLERQISMIDLNVRVLTEMCWRLFSHMGRGSRIINVASLAAFQPLGNFAVYGASKSYVRSFSMAIAAEFKPHGIKVCTLNPGSVQSGFADVASAGARKEVLHGYPPEPVVKACLKASRRGYWASMPRILWKLKAFAGAIGGPKLSALFTLWHMKRPSGDILDRKPRDQDC